jgi:hypothetical protein
VRGALKEKGRRRRVGGEAPGCGGTAWPWGVRRLDVEDGPDRWAPPVGRRKREGEERWAGGRFRGPEAERAAERKGERKKTGQRWVGLKEGGREREGLVTFFLFLF